MEKPAFTRVYLSGVRVMMLIIRVLAVESLYQTMMR
jgi:hypothetical protein